MARCSCGLCVRCTYLNRAAQVRAVAAPKPEPKPVKHRRQQKQKTYTPTGRPPGRPRAITDEQVRRAAELHEAGMTWRQIGAQLGVDFSGIRRRVRDSHPEIRSDA